MKSAIWLMLLLASSTLAQVSGFRPLTKPEFSRLITQARGGNMKSQLQLGIAFQYGFGVDANPKAAELWLKLAAGRGDQTAQTQLGLLYLDPVFASSRGQAEHWFMLAASSGSSKAEHNLGVMYMLGMGVKPDRRQAIQWFRRAVRHGSGPARADLGVLLTLSTNPADQEEGFRLIVDAAKNHVPEAENALGFCYQFGAGTKVDLPQAVDWYKRAAGHGNVVAMRNLADLYRTGAGLDLNLKEAFRWSERACKGGDPRACVNVANAYIRGEGVAQDYHKAYPYALMGGVDENGVKPLAAGMTEQERNKTAIEAERWKQAHAVQLSTSPQ